MKNLPQSARIPLLRALPAALAALTASAIPSLAEAAPCADLPGEEVYVTGGGKVLLENLGKVLSPQGTNVIYLLQGSCLAVDAILKGTPITGSAVYWDATTEGMCELDAGRSADLGISDVFPSTCVSLPSGLPSGVSDIQGPVEAYAFVVPEASTQRTISMEAAYFIFGFGTGSGVAPWDDETLMFRRNADSGTQQMLGLAIGVPPDRWKGVDAGSSGNVVMGLATAVNPEKAIGILTSEVAGANELTVNELAYQARDQTCAFWPDSSSTSRDKRNVRDGHYAIWGPIHLLARVDGNGFPLSPGADKVIQYITATQEIIPVLASTGLIPQCAMRVHRTSELGPLTSFAPDQSCGCYYESLAVGSTECLPCASPVECPAETPRCNYGFCEAH